jgi:chromosome segregation ATPase
MQNIIILIVGILGGSFGVELVKSVFGIQKIKLDDASAIRKELQGYVTQLQDEIKAVQKELDVWKEKYYQLLEKYNDEKEAWKQKYFELQEQRDKERDEYQLLQDKYSKTSAELETLRKLCTFPSQENAPQVQ